MEKIMFIVGGLLVVFIQGWVLWYFAYWKKKADNLATKEDIQEITRLTKTIENELSVISQKQIGLNSEIRNAIIHYNETLSEILNVHLHSIMKYSNSNELFKEFFNVQIQKYMLATARLELFLDDSEINDKTESIQRLLHDVAEVNVKSIINFNKKNDQAENEVSAKIKNHYSELTKVMKPLIVQRHELNTYFRKYL